MPTAVTQIVLDTKQRIEAFLRWKGLRYPRAAKNYRIPLYHFFEVVKKSAEDCHDGDLAEFKIWMEDKRFAPKTISFAFTAVRQFFMYWGKLKHEAVMDYELVTAPKGVSRSYRFLRPEEYVKMVEACDTKTYRGLQEFVVLRLLWDSAVRVSELCDLNLSDVDTRRRTLTIRTRKQVNSGNQYRTVMWSKDTHEIMLQYLGVRVSLNSEPALFQGIFSEEENTRRITPRTIERIIQRIARRAGINEKIHPHTFRHGKAHNMTRQKANLEIVRRYLGHKNIESTKHYLQFEDQEFEDMVKEYI